MGVNEIFALQYYSVLFTQHMHSDLVLPV